MHLLSQKRITTHVNGSAKGTGIDNHVTRNSESTDAFLRKRQIRAPHLHRVADPQQHPGPRKHATSNGRNKHGCESQRPRSHDELLDLVCFQKKKKKCKKLQTWFRCARFAKTLAGGSCDTSMNWYLSTNSDGTVVPAPRTSARLYH